MMSIDRPAGPGRFRTRRTRRKDQVAGRAPVARSSLQVEALEDRLLLSGWPTHAGNDQHTALSSVPAQPLDLIHWFTPVDLSGPGEPILIHYGSPLATPGNTIIVPVKTDNTGAYKVQAINRRTGALIWEQTSDYTLPPHNWTPSYSPTLTATNRLYFPGNGGTVYYRDSVDSASGATGQLAFFGMANYN